MIIMENKRDLVARLNSDTTFYLDETASNSWKLVKDTGWEDMGDSEENLLIFQHQDTNKFYQVHIARYGQFGDGGVEMEDFEEADIKEVEQKIIQISKVDYEVIE